MKIPAIEVIDSNRLLLKWLALDALTLLDYVGYSQKKWYPSPSLESKLKDFPTPYQIVSVELHSKGDEPFYTLSPFSNKSSVLQNPELFQTINNDYYEFAAATQLTSHSHLCEKEMEIIENVVFLRADTQKYELYNDWVLSSRLVGGRKPDELFKNCENTPNYLNCRG